MEWNILDNPTALHYLLDEDCQRVQGLGGEKKMQKYREMNEERSRLEGHTRGTYSCSLDVAQSTQVLIKTSGLGLN